MVLEALHIGPEIFFVVPQILFDRLRFYFVSSHTLDSQLLKAERCTPKEHNKNVVAICVNLGLLASCSDTLAIPSHTPHAPLE
jgi:hypothetical protein